MRTGDSDNTFHEAPQGGKSLMLVVSAPSGTGKTTICRELLKQETTLSFSVSYTTRPPRRGEKDGRDYHFIVESEFRNLIARDAFIEWIENFGHFYGTSRDVVERCIRSGRDVLLDVEPQGAKTLKRIYPWGVFVFMLPPSLAILVERLGKRGSEDEIMRRERSDRAVQEISEATWYDYIVTNDTVAHTVALLHSIYIAEKNRSGRSDEKIAALLKGTGGIAHHGTHNR